MALTDVLRPGHAQVRVTELEPAVHFYRDVLGLVETGREMPSGIDYPQRKLHETYLTVVTRDAPGYLAPKMNGSWRRRGAFPN